MEEFTGSFSDLVPVGVEEEKEEEVLYTPGEPFDFDSYIEKVYGKDANLSQQQITQDPNLMRVVDDSVMARYGDSSYLTRTAGTLGGGATANTNTYMKKSAEERFEIWQNWQRSFAGGQTVTTAGDLVRVHNADDDTKAMLADGYKLFDNMGNIFSEGTSWGDMFDGLWDYGRAAVIDPTTLASFGVGKLWTGAGTKATATGIKTFAKASSKAAAQRLSPKVAQEAASAITQKAALEGLKAVGKQPAKQTVKQAVIEGAKYGAVDMGAAVFSDYGYQQTLIGVDAQDGYKIGQTGLAAMSIAIIPAGLAAGKQITEAASKIPYVGRLVENFKSIKAATVAKGPEEVKEQVFKRVDWQGIKTAATEQWATFGKFADESASWADAKTFAIEGLEGTELTKLSDTQMFFRKFLFGGTDGAGTTNKGVVTLAVENGFVFVPRNTDDKVSRWVGDIIEHLGDDFVEDAVEKYQKAYGVDLGFDFTDGAAAFVKNKWVNDTSNSARQLWLASRVKGVLEKGWDVFRENQDALQKNLNKTKPEERAKYIQSVWKRMLTAHPGTTGANVKGWASLYAINTVSDAVQGVFETTYGALTGNKEMAKKGGNTLLSTINRATIFLDPDATFKEYEALMDALPAVRKLMSRDLAGDSGVAGRATLDRFNIDEAGGFGKNIAAPSEKGVHVLQALSGVTLQDEITKSFSTMTALNRNLMREYGMTYTEFMALPDANIKIREPKFLDVLTQSTDRALRETASKSWGYGDGANAMKHLARGIEKFSSSGVGGYMIPFGRFFNTTVALMGDHTGINLAHYVLKKNNVAGASLGATDKGASELIANTAVGLVGLAFAAEAGMERVKEGFKWNQNSRDDGSVEDKTYDWPDSHIRMFGQIWGHVLHAMENGTDFLDARKEVPAELLEEAATLYAGQLVRDMEGYATAAYEGLKSALVGDFQSDAFNKTFALLAGKIGGGFTRPLEPYNEAVGLVTGQDIAAQPDLREEGQFGTAANQVLRYVDHFFGGLDGDPRAYPTRGTDVDKDFGRLLGGVRSTSMPNNTERALASVGKADWKSARWKGPPELKNKLDGMFDTAINVEIEKMLEQNPGFFDDPYYTLDRRNRRVNEAIKLARDQVYELLEGEVAGGDPVMHMIRKFTNLPRAKQRQVMSYFGLDGTGLQELADMPNAADIFGQLVYMADNWDEIMD